MSRNLLIILFSLLSAMPCLGSSVSREEIKQRLEAADSLHSIGLTDSAARVGEKTIRLARESGDPALEVGAYAAQGVFLRSLGEVNEALKNYDKALRIITSGKFRESPDREAIEQIASLYINLSVLDLDMQHKEEAEKNAILSGEWVAKSDDPELKSMIFGAAGSVLTGCGRLDAAMDFQRKAYENALACDNEDAAFRAASYAMLIADRLGDKKEAEDMRKVCTDLYPGIEAMMTKLVYYQAECSIALKNNKPAEAVKWFDAILDLDGVDNLPFVKFDCYNNLHAAQAQLGDYPAAYSTLLKSNVLRDSIWEREKAESLRDLSVKYETKETQLALSKSETKRARTLMWLFIVLGALSVVAIIFILYVTRQRRDRMQREIEFANLRADIGQKLTREYIEGLENERSRMARELHDGVCNDLLAIRMNIRDGQPEDKVAGLIDNCREAVRRISHELMPPEFSYASIDEVIRYFISQQREAYKDISFKYLSKNIDTGWKDIPDAISLEIYRIIQEAVGNSVKHSGADTVKVEMDLEGDALEFSVIDNGKYPSSVKKGIGLESIKKRVAIIGGCLEIIASGIEGTAVVVKMRIHGKK